MAIYQIKRGDTLSQIAATNKTDIATLQKLNPNITDINKIYAGQNLNLPTSPIPANPVSQIVAKAKAMVAQTTAEGDKPFAGSAFDTPGYDYSKVNTISEAQKAINDGQKTDAESATIDGEPPTRKSTEDVMKEIATQVAPATPAPAAPDYTGSLLGYRSSYGVNDLETQLDQLRVQEQDLLAAKQTRVNAERGKTVATNVIEGRVSEVERQENERITAVQNSITNATNQLNTKYNIIDTLMKTKEMDYTGATAHYDKEMSNNIAMYNAAKNIEETAKTDIEKAQDTARSNAQIVLNSYTATGTTYDKLSPTEQTNLTKLGVQSGLGADFFSNALKVSSGKELMPGFPIISADQTTASLVYKDGTTKTITTGLPAKPISGEKPTSDETKVFYKQSMEAELKKVVGAGGSKGLMGGITGAKSDYVSPADWAEARKQWTSNTPYGASDFDDAFRGYIDPANPQDYAGFESYKAGFIKKSATELETGE